MMWFIADISKLCLFSWHLVALFETRSRSITLLNTYTCIFSAASLFISFFRAKQHSRDVTVTHTISLSFKASPQLILDFKKSYAYI